MSALDNPFSTADPDERLARALTNVGEYGWALEVREGGASEGAYAALDEHDSTGRYQRIVEQGYERGMMR